jgi:threonine/homoserine efflux transporter RhtA
MMFWFVLLIGIVLFGAGLMMAVGQFPSLGGPAMAWILMFMGLVILGLAFYSWHLSTQAAG